MKQRFGLNSRIQMPITSSIIRHHNEIGSITKWAAIGGDAVPRAESTTDSLSTKSWFLEQYVIHGATCGAKAQTAITRLKKKKSPAKALCVLSSLVCARHPLRMPFSHPNRASFSIIRASIARFKMSGASNHIARRAPVNKVTHHNNELVSPCPLS
jgi:hypothetical protein